MHPSLRRQGYAAEAATAVLAAARGADIDRVIAIIRPHNVASQGVARAVGMTLEREVHKNGGPALVYGISLAHGASGAGSRRPVPQDDGT